MRSYSAWSIRAQLVVLFLIILSLGGLGAWRIHLHGVELDGASHHLVNEQLPSLAQVHRLQFEVVSIEKLLMALRHQGLTPSLLQSLTQARLRVLDMVSTGALERHSPVLVRLLEEGAGRLDELLALYGEGLSQGERLESVFSATLSVSERVQGELSSMSEQLMLSGQSYPDTVRALNQQAMEMAMGANLALWLLVGAVIYLLRLYTKEHRRSLRLTSFAKRNPDPVMASNLNLEVEYANPAALSLCRLLGLSGPATLLEQIKPDAQQLIQQGDELLEREQEVGNRTLLVRMVLLKSLSQVQFHLKDISKARRVEKNMEHQVNHDFLTGLPNRRQFERDLKFWLKESQHDVVVGMLHLDRFQRVTAAIGFEGGDSVLKGATELLRNQLNKEADPDAQLSLYRFESTRFAMLWVTPFKRTRVKALAERIRRGFASPVVCVRTNRRFHFTLSQGFAATGLSERDVDSLVRDADCAAGRAAAQGGDRLCIHTPEQGDMERRRVQLEQDLRYALERNQLQVYYQKQCNHHGQIVGAEALLRWQHPELGLVPPDEFIGLAEQTGLILDIGEWVLEQACLQVCSWNGQGGEMGVAVNISARQLMDSKFVERVESVIQRTGVDPEMVEFELTESMMMENLERGKEVMLRLKALGICFAIDDFGTGYSSLAHLSQLPFDVLKIDYSFVRHLPRDPYYCKITKAVLSLANTLGLTVVAEGVEYAEQQRWLARHGCDLMQGYLHGKPMPIVEFGKVLEVEPLAH
ncbi:putative bifunctional diguanylate cyclase/phosphodiesterase [Ferrimonas futtsuensis]|uniref:putative bifunctional diguanylate cyclase/phosphodiesterase n=1 Tax=Ferrimonas futtsuensis TaxID=364764 RepID=UPI00040C7500|nr:bifunctional diguanylate cyclase/phosphodiesterase [Ferrimonas futtsuensis]